MNPGEKYLDELARKLEPFLTESPDNSRERLEATLLPMVRCALRTGLGQPCLVGWVRWQTGPGRAEPAPLPDPVRVAGPITRELSEKLWARLRPVSSRETVVNW